MGIYRGTNGFAGRPIRGELMGARRSFVVAAAVACTVGVTACGSSHDGTYLFSFALRDYAHLVDGVAPEEEDEPTMGTEQSSIMALYSTESGNAAVEVETLLMQGVFEPAGFTVSLDSAQRTHGDDCEALTNESNAELHGDFAADLGFDGTLTVTTRSARVDCGGDDREELVRYTYKGTGTFLSHNPDSHPRGGLQWGYIPEGVESPGYL